MFHKSGLELLLRKNVFCSEITDVVEGHLTKMKMCLAKREKSSTKRKTVGVQMNIEAAFRKTTNATSMMILHLLYC